MAGLDFSSRADAGGGALDFSSRGQGVRSPAQDVTGFASKVNRGLGIGDELAAGFGTARDFIQGYARLGTDQPGNVIANNARAIADTYRMELAKQRQTEDSFQAAHPHVAALATGVGNALTVAAPVGPGAAAFANGTRITNALRGATIAGLTGAGYAAVDRGPLGERAAAAAHAAHDPLTLALGAGAGALSRGAPRPAAPANDPAAVLTQAGVPTTVGQRAGGLGRRLEDAAESFPLTGAAIRARKAESLQGFDTAAINDALSPIGQQVQGHGRDAIAAANQHVSDAYNSALQGVRVAPDAQYQTEINAVLHDPRLPASVRGDIADVVQEFVVDPLQADGSGASWKRVDSDLNTLARSASNAVGTTPQSLSLQRALNRIQDAHWGLLERQAPEAATGVERADAANAAMERVRGAASSVGTAGREGVFTASDLNRAVASKGGRAGRRAYGEGNALLQNISDAGQAVLPSTVPDSGTALRSFLLKLGSQGGALAGLGAVGGHAAAAGAAAGALAADAAGATYYSRPVQNALRQMYLSRLAGAPAPGLPPAVAARLAAGAAAAEAPRGSVRAYVEGHPEYGVGVSSR